LKQYSERIAICGNKRNSYSKSDPAETFMRVKRDYMGNDQLVTVKSPYGLRTAYRSERIFQTARFLLQTLTEKISIQGDGQKW
ncbi:hypothetical protein RFZ44_06995, partial [Acinetobacter sp. 163]|nr:hypothetical protein [Acinetobacter sp. 163]